MGPGIEGKRISKFEIPFEGPLYYIMNLQPFLLARLDTERKILKFKKSTQWCMRSCDNKKCLQADRQTDGRTDPCEELV